MCGSKLIYMKLADQLYWETCSSKSKEVAAAFSLL